MSHVPHELSEEFPSQIALIGKLVSEDPEFAEMAAEYMRLNQRVYEADTYLKPMEELAEHQLKKRRAFLKDEINRRLSEA